MKSKTDTGSIRRFVWWSALVINAAAPYLVHAGTEAESQQTTGQVQGTTGAGAASALEEIIVTARKREERLQDVPVSMTAFTSADIQRYQTQSITDIAGMTPQLLVASSNNPTGVIYLRGVGASDNSASIDQAVSINVDGVQISQAQILRIAQLDLNRIEVLKGPQSLFFGKDSPGGVISLTSADPGPAFETKVRTGYEVYNQQKFIEGTVSGPVTAGLGARLDLYASDQKGWFRNIVDAAPGVTQPSTTTTPDQKQYFGRLTLAYSPIDSLDAKLKLNFGRTSSPNGPQDSDELYSCPLGVPQSRFGTPGRYFCGLGRNYTLGALSPAAAALEPHFRDGQSYITGDQTLGSLTVNYRPEDRLALTSVTGYYKAGEDEANGSAIEGPLASLPFFSVTDIIQWTEELRARTNLPGPLNFLVGGFYQNLKLYSGIGVELGVPLVPAPLLYENFYGMSNTDSYSGFGQFIYDFAPLWELTGGGRYTSESKSEAGTRYSSALNGFGPPLPLDYAVPNVHFTNVSPEATLTFKPTSDLTIYGAYRQGFVAGGFNITNNQPQHFDNTYLPETAKGGEIGAKGLFFDRQIRFDVDVYHYKYSDLQVSSFDPKTLSQNIINAAAATLQGIEGSFIYVPNVIPQLSLRGTAAYNHTKYDSFVAPCYSGQTIVQGCNLNFAGGTYNSTSLAGAPLSHAPSWTAVLGASYESPINGTTSLTSSIDTNYSGPFYTITQEDPRALQGQVWKLNLGLALHGTDNAWQVALIGKNLTNKLTLVESYESPFTGQGFGKPGPLVPSDMEGTLAPARTVMIQFTFTNALFHK